MATHFCGIWAAWLLDVYFLSWTVLYGGITQFKKQKQNTPQKMQLKQQIYSLFTACSAELFHFETKKNLSLNH